METAINILDQIHFLRPLWFLGIIPAAVIALALVLRHQQSQSWKHVMPEHFLNILLDQQIKPTQRWPVFLLLLGWLIICTALAGPAWEKIEVPVFKKPTPLIIVLDLSASMNSEDIKPSRIKRARLKILDILEANRDKLTALVAYSGSAHVTTPLTTDTKTISSLVNSLAPEIMPLAGSNLEAALEKCLELLDNLQLTDGTILLLTDGISDITPQEASKILGKKHKLMIMGIGTEAGAPVLTRKGSYLKNKSGAIIFSKLNTKNLQSFAQANNGRYHGISVNDDDFNYLLGNILEKNKNKTEQTDRNLNQWNDRGYWLIFLILPFFLLTFRKGTIPVAILVIFTLPLSAPAEANWWDDLWLNKDQQARQALQEGDSAKASELFKHPAWKASAQYQAGNYEAAASSFSSVEASDDSLYNIGNSQAKNGKLKEAIDAYKEALTINPKHEDALFNKKLVEEIIKQQQDQNQNSEDSQSEEENESDDQSGDKSDKESQGKNDSSDQNQNGQPDDNKNPSEDSEQNQNKGESEQEDKQQDQDQSEQSDEQEKEAEQNKSEEENSESEQDTNAENNDSEAQNEASAHKTPAQLQEEDETRQALNRMLLQVEDNPEGLLKNKFKKQYIDNPTKKETQKW